MSGFEPPAPPPKLATSLAGIQGHYLLIPKPIPSTEVCPSILVLQAKQCVLGFCVISLLNLYFFCVRLQPQPPQSGFDIVLYFDISSDEVFKRSSCTDGMYLTISVKYDAPSVTWSMASSKNQVVSYNQYFHLKPCFSSVK